MRSGRRRGDHDRRNRVTLFRSPTADAVATAAAAAPTRTFPRRPVPGCVNHQGARRATPKSAPRVSRTAEANAASPAWHVAHEGDRAGEHNAAKVARGDGRGNAEMLNPEERRTASSERDREEVARAHRETVSDRLATQDEDDADRGSAPVTPATTAKWRRFVVGA